MIFSSASGIYVHCATSAKFCLVVFKGGHLPVIYMHCPRSSSGCSSMHGICAELTGEGPMHNCIVLC